MNYWSSKSLVLSGAYNFGSCFEEMLEVPVGGFCLGIGPLGVSSVVSLCLSLPNSTLSQKHLSLFNLLKF